MADMRKAYTITEDRLIEELYAKNMSDAEISAIFTKRGFSRSNNSIGSRRAHLGLIDTTRPQSASRNTQEKSVQKIRMAHADLAFKAAMLNAIKSGEERAVIGVVKDRRPFVLNTIRPEPVLSMCGSSAAMCTEATAPKRKVTDGWTPNF